MNQRIVTTSFQTHDEGLRRFVNSKPMWSAKSEILNETIMLSIAAKEET